MHRSKAILLISLLSLAAGALSQQSIDSILGKVDPQKWAASIERSTVKLQQKVARTSMIALNRLQKQEEKIYKKMLRSKDSSLAKAAVTNMRSKYEGLRDKTKSPSIPSSAKAYIPKLDSLSGALKFLDQNGIGGKVKDALAKTEALQQSFQQADEIKKFIRERRQQLKQQLENLGMVKELKKITKGLYYYSAQVQEYKDILKDSKKRERKALELLSRAKPYKDFMRRNSMLASLFRIPDNAQAPLSQISLANLQTRAQVNNLIQRQLSSGGPNAQQQFRQNVQAAQSQINQLKNNLNRYGSGNSDDIMPEGFKANNQKAKAFWKRIEIGTSTQTQRATMFFPVTTDLGLTIGYKLNDKSVIGVGASYKLGWGKGWKHIKFSNEGLGFRSFIDWKLTGSLWISGGYEQNYKTAFNSIDLLRDFSAWQASGLIGISKIVKVKNKMIRKTKVQLLWDFLSYRHVPRSSPVIFRIDYNLN